MFRFSAVIPCYNDEIKLAELLSQLQQPASSTDGDRGGGRCG